MVGIDPVGALAASATSAESIPLTAPSDAGTYYYGACVDAVADESDTTDNCSASVAVAVEAPAPRPDLEVGTPTASDPSPETNAAFTLSATVRNAGDGASAATTLRYYRSADATITAADAEVGTDAVGPLAAAGDERGVDPADGAVGRGDVLLRRVRGRGGGRVGHDRQLLGSVAVAVEAAAPRPDLEVGTPTASDPSPETGAAFTLSATVRNAGDGSSTATTLRYYRSTDATISSSDTVVGIDPVGALAASATSAESIPLTAPSDAGTYYYGACVDAVADESDTTDNCSGSVAVAVEAPAPRPDLEVGTPTASDPSPETNAAFTLSATVRNAGDGASAATTLRYYRSADATITAADAEVGTDAVGPLAASATSAESIPLTAPSDAGTYYYGACADAVPAESDTTNNCSGSVAVSVGAPAQHPDLTVGSPSVTDSTPDTGGLFTVSTTVHNDGDGTSAATTLRYYRSTDATITTADTEVGTDPVGELSAGAGSQERVRVAARAAGTHYYGACVDAVMGESDTANNCSGSVRVTVSTALLGPDLRIYALVAADLSSGGWLSAEVVNDGDQSSAATTVRFYRSTNDTITTADTQVATDAVGELSAGATIDTRRVRVTVPSDAGTYYYGVCVDSVTGESDTTNNCFEVSVAVTVEERD